MPIITTSSPDPERHCPAATKINFDDLRAERRYRPFAAFGVSKVAT